MSNRNFLKLAVALIMLSLTPHGTGAVECPPDVAVLDLEFAGNGPRPHDFDVDGDTMIFFDSRPEQGQRIRFFLDVDGTWQEDVGSEIVLSGDDVTWIPHRKVSISGNTAVVGLELGKVIVLERIDGTWDIVQTLTAPEPEYTFYGLWVDIDGDVIVVSDFNAKAVYVHRREGKRFELEATLSPPDPDDYFARGVAVGGDAILVGGAGGSVDDVFCFRHEDDRWIMHQVIDPETPSMNYDLHGDTAIIGDGIYVLESGEWNHAERLNVPDGYAIDSYQSRRIGADFAVLGASLAGSPHDASSHALVYERGDSGWALVSEVLCQVECSYGFGQCISYTIACVFDRQVFMGLKEDGGFWATGVLVHTYPEDCGCESDIDGDGNVGVDDLLVVIAGWGNPYGIDDLLSVIGEWGTCEP